MVCRAHHVFVVFNHQHAVANIPQVLQRADQAVVVALMQADAGLVKHVHDPGQTRANLAGQPDALRLATTERFGAAVQAQVGQAHIIEKFQPQANLAHHLGGNVAFGTGHVQRIEVIKTLRQRLVAQLKNCPRLRAFTHLDVACLAAQAAATTFRAGLCAAITRQVLTNHRRVGFPVTPLHIWNDAFKRVLLAQALSGIAAGVQGVIKLDLLIARSVQNGVLYWLGQRFKGLLNIKLVMRGQAFEHGKVVCIASVPAFDGTTGQTQPGKCHDPCRIKKVLLPQSVTTRTGTRGGIE